MNLGQRIACFAWKQPIGTLWKAVAMLLACNDFFLILYHCAVRRMIESAKYFFNL